jgi:arylsulfatase A-like enzyme
MHCIRIALWIGIAFLSPLIHAAEKPNVLFIIVDDLTANALSCYKSGTAITPSIDRLAAQGTRYSRAYCQFPVCGPSRASLLSGYYPHGSGTMGYVSGRKEIGPNRSTWPQHFAKHGYHTARVSKIFHMGVPGEIESGSDGADDPDSWHERFNSQGPEWKAPGDSELLENNRDGTKGVKGGNTLELVKADGDDLVHSDGQTALKACELLKKFKADSTKPFFLAVGFVRPHVPFVAPRSYYDAYPWDKVTLPEKVEGDWNDIPIAGINYKTSKNLDLDEDREKKAIAAYYASVAFMDAQVGKVLDALAEEGLDQNTIVVFTSDHGFHLGEHLFWMKVSLMEESARVPLIIKVPGKQPATCYCFAELVDLYPTLCELCGLPVPPMIQGKSLAKTLDDPTHFVRDAAFCVNGMNSAFLLRTDRWAYIRHGRNGENGKQLYDMESDPGQYHNLAQSPESASLLRELDEQLDARLQEIEASDIRRENRQ